MALLHPDPGRIEHFSNLAPGQAALDGDRMNCRIIERNNRYYPQYEFRGQWRHYENCFEHEIVCDSYADAKQFIRAKLDDLIQSHERSAKEHADSIKAYKKLKSKF